MVTQLPLTRLLNANLAGPVDKLLGALHVHTTNPQAPIDNAFAMELLVFCTLLLYCRAACG
jgi:F-type H+-transporting ATPase subunit a